MHTHLFIEATYSIVGKAKGQELVRRQTAMFKIPLEGVPTDPNLRVVQPVFLAVVGARLIVEIMNHFVFQLKTDSALKRHVGGTKWCVNLIGEVEEMPWYLSAANLGDYEKFIDKRNFYKIMEQIVHRNMAIMERINDERRKLVASNTEDILKQA